MLGASDDFAYNYSTDSKFAYISASAVVLARVVSRRTTDLNVNENYVKKDDSSETIRSSDLAKRGPVFAFPNGCNRLDVVYNSALGKNLVTMRSRTAKNGQHSGIDRSSVHESDFAWGPWRMVFCTENWDVDPGEVVDIPSQCISGDGKRLRWFSLAAKASQFGKQSLMSGKRSDRIWQFRRVSNAS